MQLREPGRLEAPNVALASAEEHDDALGFEPPGDEHERICGCVVEPLGIVDEAQERLIFRGLGEQAQDCERDEEAVLASPCCQAERSTEGGGLRRRKALYVPENRADDLVQSGERELRLRFHPGAAEHAHVAGLVARVLQKRGLADARLAGDDEDGAPRRASAIEKLADTRAFRVSPVEHVRVIVTRLLSLLVGIPAKSPARRRDRAPRGWRPMANATRSALEPRKECC